MEEDIKILEEMLNSKEPVCNYILKHQEIEAISNLLTRYKELEEWKKEKGCSIQEVYELFIPKSKVKEKIEELEREFDFYAGREHFEWQDGEFDGEVCDDIAFKIGVLKNLLREE